jgi:hypothetical protein
VPFAAAFLGGASFHVFAQSHQHDHAAAGRDAHQGHGTSLNAGGQYLLSQSSGTAAQASAWPMPMVMSRLGRWSLMWMGQAFVVATQQTGPRGADKIYSANWGMLAGVRTVGRGSLMLRVMPTLEPLTITRRRYPLLFQTGESAYGKPIVDGQHPHELLMELSAQYAHPVGEGGIASVYYAPVGDAALGPVAFPHRASAMEIPQATLAHHWQDATHIANNVLTAGFGWNKLRLEASGFRGKEPDENRWNIDMGAMDSWSSRLSINPHRNWTAQLSGGRLTRPEQFHPDDIVRTTASVHHIAPRSSSSWWATSLIWARNYKTIAKRASHAVIAETLVPLTRRNLFTARLEWSQRDELFENDHRLAHEVEERTGRSAFAVTAVTGGYTRDIGTVGKLQTGLGGNVTAYAIDNALEPYYGNRPWAMSLYLRVRLSPSE